jgi:hypothetical protein
MRNTPVNRYGGSTIIIQKEWWWYAAFILLNVHNQSIIRTTCIKGWTQRLTKRQKKSRGYHIEQSLWKSFSYSTITFFRTQSTNGTTRVQWRVCTMSSDLTKRSKLCLSRASSQDTLNNTTIHLRLIIY